MAEHMEILTNVSSDGSMQPDAAFIDPENYASKPKMREAFSTKILPLVQRTRTQRAGLENFWQRMYMVWAAQNDNNTRLYSGMSDQYLPSVNTAIKTLIGHLRAEIFGAGDRAIAVVPNPLDPFAQQASPIVQMLQQRNFDLSGFKQNFRNWVWQAYYAGCSPFRCDWKVKRLCCYKPVVSHLDPQTMKPVVTLQEQEISLFEGPVFKPVNLLRWYIYPFTVQSIEEAEMIFQDDRLAIDEFDSMGKEGSDGRPAVWANVTEALEKKPTISSDLTQTQGYIDSRTSMLGLFETQIPDENRIMTTEVYYNFDISNSGRRVPCRFTYVGDVLIEARQLPLIDQKPPFGVLRFEDTFEHFYGRSKIQNVESMNLAQNAAFNQGIDANMFAGNPITGVNAIMLQGRVEDMEIAPLAIMAFNGDPKQGMMFYDIPNTLQANLMLVETLQDTIEKSMQATPALSGEIPDKEGVTATAVNAAEQGAAVGISEDAMIIKTAMKDFLQMAWKRTQQFYSTQPQVSLIPAFNFSPAVLVGEHDWDFLSGSEAQAYINAQQSAVAQAQMMQAEGGRKGAAISANTPGGNGENNQPGGADYGQT